MDKKRMAKICKRLFIVFSILCAISYIIGLVLDSYIENEIGGFAALLDTRAVIDFIREEMMGEMGSEDLTFLITMYLWEYCPLISKLTFVGALVSAIGWYFSGGRFSDFKGKKVDFSEKVKNFSENASQGFQKAAEATKETINQYKITWEQQKTQEPIKEKNISSEVKPETPPPTRKGMVYDKYKGTYVAVDLPPETDSDSRYVRSVSYSGSYERQGMPMWGRILIALLLVALVIIWFLYHNGYFDSRSMVGTTRDEASGVAEKIETATYSSNSSQAFDYTSSSSITWGPWSEWSTTKPAEYSNRQIETDTRTEYGVITTVYHYKRFLYYSYQHERWNSSNKDASAYGEGAWFEYEQTGSPLTYKRTSDSGYKCYYGPVKNGNDEWWEDEPYTTQEQSSRQVTYYRYRDQTSSGTSSSPSSSSSSYERSSSPSYAYLVKTPVTIYGMAYESNLIRACAALNGKRVTSGGSFSFNAVVGPRTKEAGYQEATNGRGSKVVGGGVSQVASTLHLALRRTGHVVYDEFTTYGDNFTAGYVDNTADAVVTDYRNNRDFAFTNYGEGFTIYMWCDGDYVYCGLSY